ncbi:MAG: ParA family protein [Planctomycetota bacterium]
MPDARPVRAIALMNQKGGVGKTTTAVHIAHALARAGRPTLLADLDPQAHATIHLGIDPDADHPGVLEVLARETTVQDAAIDRSENLSVLPAHTDLASIEPELAAESDRNHRLRDALADADGRYEFVIIDCPPSLGLLTLNALAAAREVVIPMQPHFLALQGVSKLLETVRVVQARLNDKLRVLGVAVCMHEPQTTLAQEVLADLKEFFDASREQPVPWSRARVLSPAVRRNVKLAECPSHGQTIFEYAPDAAGAKDYVALAATLIAEWDAMLERRGLVDPKPIIAPSLPTPQTTPDEAQPMPPPHPHPPHQQPTHQQPT